jgi:hypothetical protein
MDNVTLLGGSHDRRDQGVCVMEAVAWFAGEQHSDQPQCVCPVIAAFARGMNDWMSAEDRQRLKPMIPALALSRAEWPITLKRAYIAADYAVRVFAPIALDARGVREEAARLRALDEIVDPPTALTAKAAAHAASAAYAAASAAYAAYAAYAAAAAYAAYAAAASAARSLLADLGIECLEKMLSVKP